MDIMDEADVFLVESTEEMEDEDKIVADKKSKIDKTQGPKQCTPEKDKTGQNPQTCTLDPANVGPSQIADPSLDAAKDAGQEAGSSQNQRADNDALVTRRELDKEIELLKAREQQARNEEYKKITEEMRSAADSVKYWSRKKLKKYLKATKILEKALEDRLEEEKAKGDKTDTDSSSDSSSTESGTSSESSESESGGEHKANKEASRQASMTSSSEASMEPSREPSKDCSRESSVISIDFTEPSEKVGEKASEVAEEGIANEADCKKNAANDMEATPPTTDRGAEAPTASPKLLHRLTSDALEEKRLELEKAQAGPSNVGEEIEVIQIDGPNETE